MVSVACLDAGWHQRGRGDGVQSRRVIKDNYPGFLSRLNIAAKGEKRGLLLSASAIKSLAARYGV